MQFLILSHELLLHSSSFLTLKRTPIVAMLGIMMIAGPNIVTLGQSKPSIGQKGKLVFIDQYRDRAQLDSLYAATSIPVVIIAGQLYLPQSPCAQSRQFGGDTEQRNIAGDMERRNLAGSNEQRVINGSTEQRLSGGETERRNIAGESEERSISGDSERRSIAGDSDQRTIAGSSENRSLAGNTEDRRIAGSSEQRAISGESESRNLSGETERRQLAGASVELDCYAIVGAQGFLIFAPPTMKITVFDGREIRVVEMGLVLY